MITQRQWIKVFKEYAKKTITALSKIAAICAGMILLPVTLPFLAVADHFRQSEQHNRSIWHTNVQLHRKSKWNHIRTIAHIVGASFVNFLKTWWVFAKAFGLACKEAFQTGYRQGMLSVLSTPANRVNVYTIEGNEITGTLYFRSQHLLKLALIVGVMTGVAITIATLAAPASFHFLVWVGIQQASGVLSVFLTFITSTALATAVMTAGQFALFALIRINQSIANSVAEYHNYAGNKAKFIFAKLGYFFDELFAIVLGVPVYLIFKPFYHLLHAARAWLRSCKKLWRGGKAYALSKKSIAKEYAIKVGLVFAVLGNSLLRLAMLPIQLFMSIRYAPYQAVRHASQYGLAHVLKYPLQYVNNYRSGLFLKDGSPYDGNAKKNYNNISLAVFENVYYFRPKHVLIVAIVTATVLTILTYLVPPLGYISVSLGIKLMTPLGFGSFVLSGLFHGVINFAIGFIGTFVVAAGVYVAAKLFGLFSWCVNNLHRRIKKQSSLNHFLHKEIEQGEVFKVMKRENLLVKTIASTITNAKITDDMSEEEARLQQYGVNWVFNLDQFKNPSGYYISEKNRPTALKEGDTPRPIYMANDPRRKFERNKTYERLNPKTGEWETKKMGGERGRARFDMWLKYYLSFGLIPMTTKKTCVSLAPKDAMMKFFGAGSNAIAIAMDLSKLATTDDKYVFESNAMSNAKWWWRWNYSPNLAVRSITNQQLRNYNKIKRMKNLIPAHNERIVRLHKDALVAIIVPSREREDRINGLLRKLIIKYELGLDLPVIMAGKLYHDNSAELPPQEYTVEQQLVDLCAARVSYHDYRSTKACDQVEHSYLHTDDSGENEINSFARTLINSNRINWATVFKHIDEEQQITKDDFKKYVKDAADVVITETVHQKFMPTHFVPRCW